MSSEKKNISTGVLKIVYKNIKKKIVYLVFEYYVLKQWFLKIYILYYMYI